MPRRRSLLIASQPVTGGVARHVLDVVTSLDPERYEIDVACPPGAGLWNELEGRDGVRLHALTAARAPSPADLGSLARLLPLVRRADVIHGHSAKAGFLVRAAAKATGRRRACVFTPHAWSFWANDAGAPRLYRTLERTAARWCRTIMVGSEAERRAGLAAGVGRAEQYRVVPNGVDLERFSATPDPVPGRVLVVGRLSAQKRPDVALRAAAALRPRMPELELHLVGTGPQREEVVALAAELGLEDVVRLLGGRDDVPELLSQAACVLSTSDYEGCPLAVLEAMAAGATVVASAVGGVPEVIEHGRTGLLFEPGDPEAAAAAVATVLNDPATGRRLADAGRAEARRRFGRERMAAEVEAIYDELLVGR